MTLQAIINGPLFPACFVGNPRLTTPLSLTTVGTMDATAEKVAMAGRVFWADGANKSLSTAAKVHWKAGVSTFADGGTTLRIGLQDVLGAGVAAVTPDDTFDLYADLTGGAGVTSNAANSTTLSTSGSKTVNHGDLIAVVWDMTARAGADSVIVQGLNGTSAWVPPGSLTNTGTWAISSGAMPNVLLEADDGVFGVLVGIPHISNVTTYAFQDSTNPDERGLIFQVPFKCKVNGVWIADGTNNTAADYTVTLYSTPLGTPASMASLAVIGDHGTNTTTGRPHFYPLAEQTLEAATDYCVAVKATGTSNANVTYAVVAAAHRAAMGLTNCRAGNRNASSGAFAETTTEIPFIAVQISALSDDAGGGGGLALPVVRP